MTADVCVISVRNMTTIHFEGNRRFRKDDSMMYTPRVEVSPVHRRRDATAACRGRPLGLNDDEDVSEAIAYLDRQTPERLSESGSDTGDEGDMEVASVMGPSTQSLTVERRPRDRSRSPIVQLIDLFETGVDAVSDVIGEAGHFAEYCLKKLAKRESIQEEPENNVHLIHPVFDTIVGMGMHIGENKFGCHAIRVIEGGLASKFKLKHGDVIRKINGMDLKNLTLEKMVQIFAGLDITKSIELRVVRLYQGPGGKVSLYEIDITITITISEDNVTLEVEAVVMATYLKYDGNTKDKYISQTRHDRSTVFMRVDGNHAHLNTKLDRKSQFQMEKYQGGSRGRRVCVIRNVASYSVIDKTVDWSTELGAMNAPAPKKNQIESKPDDKFFYWITAPGSDDDVFQSITDEHLYMSAGDNDSLYLEHFDSVNGSVASRARFKVIDAKKVK